MKAITEGTESKKWVKLTHSATFAVAHFAACANHPKL